MQERFLSPYKRLCLTLLLTLIVMLAACNSSNAGDSGVHSTAAPGVRSSATVRAEAPTGDAGTSSPVPTTSTDALPGARPCPAAVSNTSYWHPIIPTQSRVRQVARLP